MPTFIKGTETFYYYRDRKGLDSSVRVICDTVDDLDSPTRVLVLKLVVAARQGPLGETMWNIYDAQTEDIRRRVRENTEVRQLTNWRTGASVPA